MKVLIAIDSSPGSQRILEEVAAPRILSHLDSCAVMRTADHFDTRERL